MTLPASGAITLAQVNTELGYASTAAISLNDAAVRTLFGKPSGAISLSDGYGKSNYSKPPSVEYLVVAGGGYSGTNADPYLAGGGGAGGLRTATGYAVTTGAYTVTVGGGAQNSVFDTITASAGGSGGTGDAGGTGTNGAAGGSGGGGGGSTTAPGVGGSGTSGQGYDGGLANLPNGGGGGGAGGAGAAATATGYGGVGVASSITGAAVTYATGGNAGQQGVASQTNNNLGDGGHAKPAGTNGQFNAGTSGVVVIRYADSYSAAISTTGSPTVTVAGGWRIYKWTASGSITF